MPGTTPRARAIGAELRRAREDAGLSARQLAQKLELSHTTINRWETGVRAPRPVDVATVLSALGADNSVREELVELARNSDGPRWVATGIPEQQRQLAALLELERDATRIVSVSPLLIPGYLQTSGYARAIMRAAEVPPEEIETRVAVRVGRRDVLTRTDLLAFIDESALYRVIGGPDVMREQLTFLHEASKWQHVDLRVVPMRADWNPALEGQWLLVETTDHIAVQLENRRSALFFHEPADIDAYAQAAEKLKGAAMSPAATTDLIARALESEEEPP